MVCGVFLLPPVQTWLAQRFLDRHEELEATVAGCAAVPGRVRLTDLRLKLGRARVAVPTVELRLPLWPVLRHGRAEVQSLVARGWMIDLTGRTAGEPAPANRPAAVASAGGTGPIPPAVHAAARLARTLLGESQLPDTLSIGGVELEGDVFVPVGEGGGATPVHVKLTGGGLTAGVEAVFAVEAGVEPPTGPFRQIKTRGRATLTVSAAGEVAAVRMHLDTAGTLVSRSAELTWTTDAALERSAAGESYRLDVQRGGRAIAHVQAQRAPMDTRLAGDWKLDLTAPDFHQLFALAVPEAFTLRGEGNVAAGAGLAGGRLAGRLTATGVPGAWLAGALPGAGALPVALDFDLTHEGRFTRLDRCDGRAGSGDPVIQWRLTQSVDLGEPDVLVTPADREADWVEITLRSLPASWLAMPDQRCRLTAGAISGRLAMRATDRGLSLRSSVPLELADLAVESAGGRWLASVDGSVGLSVDLAPAQWEVRVDPLTLVRAGRQVAKVTATLAHAAGVNQPVAITAAWNVDLDALATQPLNRAGWIRGQSASGEFHGSTQGWIDGEATLAVVGHDPTHTFAAKASVQAEPDGTLSISAPVTLAFGAERSAFTAKVEWTAKDGRVQAELAGERAVVDQLRVLAPLVVGLGDFLTSRAGPLATGTALPLWGAWVGRVDTNFDQLNLDGREYVNVGGTFRFDHGALSLEGGRGKLPPPKPATGRRPTDDEVDRFLEKRGPSQIPARFSGSVTFDPAGLAPYRLTGTAEREEVDVSAVFPAPKEGADASFEGRFTTTTTYAGEGATVQELTSRLHREIKFRSTTGLVRLLTANIAASLPRPKESAAGNALSGFGTAAGWLFGNNKAFAGSGEIRVSKTMEAVLDFRNSIREIGYEELTGTVIHERDGSVRLVDFVLTGKDEHLTGSGTIAPAGDAPLRERPLSFTLQFGARGRIAGLLSTADLLSTRNDDAGYLLLKRPVHFSGTLAAIDDREWRELLVSAATKKPASDAKPR